MSSPAVSVVMPVHNAEDFIVAAVTSALRQTLADVEVVVVNDRCSDASIPNVLAMDDPRVRVIDSDAPGLASARNTGIRASNSEFIALLDADDWWHPENLQKQVGVLRRYPGNDMTFAASVWVDIAGNPMRRTVVRWNGTLSYEQLLMEFMPVNGSSMVVRRRAVQEIGGFDSGIVQGGDHEFALRIALLRDGNILGLRDSLIYYRRRPGQVTAAFAPRMLAWEGLLEKHRRLAPEVVSRVAPRATARLCRAVAAMAWEAGNYGEARRLFARALRGAPGHLLKDRRTWRTGAAVLSSWLPAPVRSPIERWAR